MIKSFYEQWRSVKMFASLKWERKLRILIGFTPFVPQSDTTNLPSISLDRRSSLNRGREKGTRREKKYKNSYNDILW